MVASKVRSQYIDAHASNHANGGADEVNLSGLSGVTADPQRADTIVEAGSAIDLVVGIVADGQILKRVGSTIVGGTSGGGGSLTQLTKITATGIGSNTCGSVLVGTKLYFLDGINVIDIYDTTTDTWTYGSTSMPSQFATGGLHMFYNTNDSLIYVISGYSTNTTEFLTYNPVGEVWSQALSDTGGAGATFYQFQVASSVAWDGADTVYVWLLKSSTSEGKLYTYSISGDSWSAVVNPFPAGYPAIISAKVAIKGIEVFILCAGGAPCNSQNVFKYNTVTNVWTRLADFPNPLYDSGGGLFVFNGRIYAYIYASGTVTNTSKYVFIYDETSDTWSSAFPLDAPNGASNMFFDIGSATEIGLITQHGHMKLGMV